MRNSTTGLLCGATIVTVLVPLAACGDNSSAPQHLRADANIEIDAGTQHGLPLAVLASVDAGDLTYLAYLSVYGDGRLVDREVRLLMPGRVHAIDIEGAGDNGVVAYSDGSGSQVGLVTLRVDKWGSGFGAEVLDNVPLTASNAPVDALSLGLGGGVIAVPGSDTAFLAMPWWNVADQAWEWASTPSGDDPIALFDLSIPDESEMLFLRKSGDSSEIVPVSRSEEELSILDGGSLKFDRHVDHIGVDVTGRAFALMPDPTVSGSLIHTVVRKPDVAVWSLAADPVAMTGVGSHLALSRTSDVIVVLVPDPAAATTEIQTFEVSSDGVPVRISGQRTAIDGTVHGIDFGYHEVLLVSHETQAGWFLATYKRPATGENHWDRVATIELEGAISSFAVGGWSSDTD